ncbi:MAG: pyrroline-5-carboxylate reductase, partial [Promicromonosporaceae bacterium]|nr:pyrroline-5-carboxylate reductase [Promicromonosporaceae bacterium]
VGAGVCVLSAGADAQRGHVELVKAIFAGAGTVVELPEHYQAAAGAVAGSGPAYVFYLIDAMAEAGVAAGLSRPVAQQLAIDTVLGSAQLLAQTGEHPALARERVTSPGGTTIQALRVLDQRGVRAAVVDAIAAAVARTGELTDELEEA